MSWKNKTEMRIVFKDAAGQVFEMATSKQTQVNNNIGFLRSSTCRDDF